MFDLNMMFSFDLLYSKQLLPQVEDVLYTKDKGKKNFSSKHSSNDDKRSNTKRQSKGNSKDCYRCGKLGHLKRNYHIEVVCNQCGKPGHIKPNCQVNLMKPKQVLRMKVVNLNNPNGALLIH